MIEHGPAGSGKKLPTALLTPSDFKYEYCGFASEEDNINNRRSLLKGICDDNQGPNDESVLNWDNQYCQVPFANSIATSSRYGKTVRVGGSANYCIKNASTTYKGAGKEYRINDGKWNNEYCGYADQQADLDNEPTLLKGVCGNGSGPNASSWGNEYCGVSAKGTVSAPSNKYCGITAMPATSDFTGSVNKDTWKEEYCGYADQAAFEADPKVVTVLSGICGDDQKPNEEGSNWENQYCQVPFENKTTGKSVRVSATASGSAIFQVYCLQDTSGVVAADYLNAPESARINDREWKDEYCGFESKSDFDSRTFKKLTGI